jgi:hypothetical protein
MTRFTNIRNVTFEFFASRNVVVVRMIAFNTDPLTGARCVEDIMEVDFDGRGGPEWLADRAAEYTTASDTDVLYTFRLQPTTEEGKMFIAAALGTIDTGKTRKLNKQILRAIEVVAAGIRVE